MSLGAKRPGGMGAVYLTRDVYLARDVAIKTLERASASGVARLRQEAQVLAAVSHTGIAQIHGIESWLGRLLLVVEYLAGGTLAERLRGGPLPATAAVGIALAVADALAALHESGYLHGDVKPSNIGFTLNGTTKLLDFGLSRLADDGGGLAGGTVPYLSPELLGGSAPGEADDVWALGVVLYEMTVGTAAVPRRCRRDDGADSAATHPQAVRRAGGRWRPGGGGRVRRVDVDGGSSGASGHCARFRQRPAGAVSRPPGPSVAAVRSGDAACFH